MKREVTADEKKLFEILRERASLASSPELAAKQRRLLNILEDGAFIEKSEDSEKPGA